VTERVPLMRLRDVRVQVGESQILQGVSFDVQAGGVTGLLGRNGVGKTTTLRGILGILPRTGSITVEGDELTGLATHEVVRRGIAYVPEDREVFGSLSVAENLQLAERGAGARPRYDLVYDLFPELKERRAQRAGTLSGGQQQMVAIARALLNENRLLLVDEPTKGLSPLLVRNVVEVLRRAADVATVLLVEQNLSVAHALARDVVVLDQGRVCYTGTADALMSDPALARRHLGLSGPGAVPS